MMTHTFVLGCGYVGTRVARQCLKQGRSVTGLVRTGGSSARLTQAGVRPVRRDLATDDLSDLTFAG
ncbi:MAG: SDR family NAD(P)-dependent oxidoreductase, partial [Thiocapsa sp.]|nr:SDR family NAD(P)-dependent oxidoreductase [Thiocapsa sp.]